MRVAWGESDAEHRAVSRDVAEALVPLAAVILSTSPTSVPVVGLPELRHLLLRLLRALPAQELIQAGLHPKGLPLSWTA